MSPIYAILVGLALAGQTATAGSAARPTTDANLVTGLDISGSMPGADRRMQLAGIAAALRSPELIAAIRHGREGRIGFAVFAWHHHRYEVVPWTLIAGPAEAEAVARVVEARMDVDVNAEARRVGGSPGGRLTDLSRAIDHAGALLATAPFATRRRVVNIVGNGVDNLGEPAVAARDRLLGTGASVNAVVFGFGADGAVLDYYRDEVTGGPGAFVLTVEGGVGIAEAMRRKFLQDLMVSHPASMRGSSPAGRRRTRWTRVAER
jgi:hypothetical protein